MLHGPGTLGQAGGYQRCIDPDSADVEDISTRKEAWALRPIEGGVASGGYVTAV